jgi:hypothetical protein
MSDVGSPNVATAHEGERATLARPEVGHAGFNIADASAARAAPEDRFANRLNGPRFNRLIAVDGTLTQVALQVVVAATAPFGQVPSARAYTAPIRQSRRQQESFDVDHPPPGRAPMSRQPRRAWHRASAAGRAPCSMPSTLRWMYWYLPALGERRLSGRLPTCSIARETGSFRVNWQRKALATSGHESARPAASDSPHLAVHDGQLAIDASIARAEGQKRLTGGRAA